MMRRRENRVFGRKKFSRTARKVHPKNLRSSVMRGGYRL